MESADTFRSLTAAIDDLRLGQTAAEHAEQELRDSMSELAHALTLLIDEEFHRTAVWQRIIASTGLTLRRKTVRWLGGRSQWRAKSHRSPVLLIAYSYCQDGPNDTWITLPDPRSKAEGWVSEFGRDSGFWHATGEQLTEISSRFATAAQMVIDHERTRARRARSATAEIHEASTALLRAADDAWSGFVD
jgi:hypothetical protein